MLASTVLSSRDGVTPSVLAGRHGHHERAAAKRDGSAAAATSRLGSGKVRGFVQASTDFSPSDDHDPRRYRRPESLSRRRADNFESVSDIGECGPGSPGPPGVCCDSLVFPLMITRAQLIDVLFVIVPHSLLLDIAGPAEAFRLANLHRERRGLPPRFRLRFAGPWRPRRRRSD